MFYLLCAGAKEIIIGQAMDLMTMLEDHDKCRDCKERKSLQLLQGLYTVFAALKMVYQICYLVLHLEGEKYFFSQMLVG